MLLPQATAGGVAARGLHCASASQLAALKEGEQDKQKSYMAVCWLPRPLTEADAALLESTRELEILQQTPVRVLHRRANLERPRTVHEMHAMRLAGQPAGYFALRLRAQAGTYIKEFVHGERAVSLQAGASSHSCISCTPCRAELPSIFARLPAGDLSRSRPSLGDLLGCKAQILTLDVLKIHMEFGCPQQQEQ